MTVVFEPQPARRSTARGVRWLVLASAAAVGLAVLKPWGATPERAHEPPPPNAGRDDSPASLRRAAPPLPPGIVDLPRWAAVAGAIGDHHAWGVGVVADNPTPPNPASVEGRGTRVLLETWQPVGIAEGTIEDPLVIASTTPVRLVRLTVPDDVRIDRYKVAESDGLGRWEAMPFVRLVWFRRRPALIVPSDPGRGFTLWRSGTYRLAVQLGDGTTRHVVFRLEAPTTATR